MVGDHQLIADGETRMRTKKHRVKKLATGLADADKG
jgi:hypothetical protein